MAQAGTSSGLSVSAFCEVRRCQTLLGTLTCKCGRCKGNLLPFACLPRECAGAPITTEFRLLDAPRRPYPGGRKAIVRPWLPFPPREINRSWAAAEKYLTPRQVGIGE